MKYDFDSYGLYQTGKVIRHSVRVKVRMNDVVDGDVLRKSVNMATQRYPYFRKKITVNEEGAYVLLDNSSQITVFKTKKHNPELCSKEVNNHILYVDYEDRDIYFNISHSFAGGKGIQPWVMTCVYQYVKDKYNVEINAPAIRKPGSELLETETGVPTYDLLSKEEPIFEYVPEKTYSPYLDYVNGFVNPFAKKECYYIFTFKQDEIMKYCRISDSSVASLFNVLMFKALDKVLPENIRSIRGILAHNPCSSFGIKDAHSDFLSHIKVDYTREMAKYDMRKLGTITRGQMILQSDPSVSSVEVKKKLDLYKGIDDCTGLKEKRKYAKENNLSLGKGAVHGAYHVNYTGYYDWGDLVNYVESFVFIVDAHLVIEVSALGDKIFFAPMQLVKSKKYIKAFEEVLKELNISYKLEGPYDKKLPAQDYPR